MSKSSHFTKRQFFVMGFTLLFIVSGGLIYIYKVNSGYNNPSFKAYLKEHHYCAGYYGGETETDEQIYKQWKENELIGC